MTNTVAPYNNPETMREINEWWDTTYPSGKTENTNPIHIIELFKSFEAYTGRNFLYDRWLTPNQFAKCLVAAKITDVGGWWERLDNWVPKEYEIRRAKVY